MPTYVYICQKCGHQFDQFQPISAEPLSTCPKKVCPEKRWGKGKVKRAITGGAGLIFKGSGFYITDYRSDKYKEAAKKDSSTPAASDSKTSSSADTKKAPVKPESHDKSSSAAKS
jgi:putative FmdB family regulatory protein